MHQLAVCFADMTRCNNRIKTNFGTDVARIKIGCSGCHHQQRPARAIGVYACHGPRLKAFAHKLFGKIGDDIGQNVRTNLAPDEHRNPKLFQGFAPI